ncbi:MAG: fatty acid desaturase [Myxococcales bacterium]|nr:fatty acid desaturase [Myxococcales bacterium]
MFEIQRSDLEGLTDGARFSVPRLGLDLTLWAAGGWLAWHAGHPVLTALIAAVVGASVGHDVMVHGHEATHGNAARQRSLNALVLWLCHALFGLSGRAYRAFHLDHHRTGHGPDDSELALYGDAPSGASYLRIAWYAPIAINGYRGTTRVTHAEVATDLLGALALHASLAWWLTPAGWSVAVLLPIALGAVPAAILRAITEHHGAPEGHTRATAAHPVLRWLWSNVDHHLEHHLAPAVPWHRLPALRARLQERTAEAGIAFDQGLIPTALRLLAMPDHVGPAGPAPDVAHHLKVRWFRDILRCPEARRHLWSLYYHGEAYEQLHPLGVWVDKLAPRWGRKLRRQLDDENRHASLFTELLAREGHTPRPLQGEQDVGWYLLHHVVPDVCAAAGDPGRFDRVQTMRYLAFLHALESRSVSDLRALARAATAEGHDDVVTVVHDILEDEAWHATWTWVALCRLAEDPQEALDVFEEVRRGEQRASHRVVARLLVAFTALGARPDGVARLRWGMMAVAARLGLAVPPLPVRAPVAPDPKETRHAA